MKNEKNNGRLLDNKVAVVSLFVIILCIIFIVTFIVTTIVFNNVKKDTPIEPTVNVLPVEDDDVVTTQPLQNYFDMTTAAETTTNNQVTTEAATTKAQTASNNLDSGNIPFPSDTASWKLICVNRNRRVPASSEDSINLKYVAGSGEMMDSRAAAAYEQMYSAAANDGIYLTPCSGYRSYSTQKRLFNEFYNEYLAQGYSENEAFDLTCRRRNPAGSSEHNLGICMDIICASSSANFENTKAYAWLSANAQDYGFILRYPADKTSITGVKFEPWHWRYVGVENAAAIKNSGLCLEEYLGVS